MNRKNRRCRSLAGSLVSPSRVGEHCAISKEGVMKRLTCNCSLKVFREQCAMEQVGYESDEVVDKLVCSFEKQQDTLQCTIEPPENKYCTTSA